MIDKGLQGQYAGLVTRAVAWILDVAVISLTLILTSWIVTSFLGIFFGFSPNECLAASQAGSSVGWMCWLVTVGLGAYSVLFAPVYMLFFWIAAGQTPGKAIMGVRVVRLNGKRMTLLAGIRRLVGYAIAIIPLGLGFWWVLWDDRRQGWQDKIAGTCVVYAWRARQNERLVASVRRALKRRGGEPEPESATPPEKRFELVTLVFKSVESAVTALDLVEALVELDVLIAEWAALVKRDAHGVLKVSRVDSRMVPEETSSPYADVDWSFVEESTRRALAELSPQGSAVLVILESLWVGKVIRGTRKAGAQAYHQEIDHAAATLMMDRFPSN